MHLEIFRTCSSESDPCTCLMSTFLITSKFFVMRRILVSAIILLAITLITINPARSQNIAINTNGSTPDVSAMLDIVNSAKGLLIPRVSLTSTTDAATIATPATSLLVYNTNASILR